MVVREFSGDPMSEKILVVDDEKDLVDLVCYNLEKAGFRAVRAYDGEAALRKAQAEGPDAVVLDLMLPLLDGWGVLKRLRAEPRSAKLPVLMLTARGEETDKVLGLELGADDYLTKPFSPRELVARVRALLRRSKPAPAATPSLGPALSFEGLEIDPGAHEVRVKKKAVELTAREFQLLAYFAARPGRVVTREILLEELWQMDPDVETRTVDVHMRRLRQKLGPVAAMLKTVRGVGYKFAPGGKG
jgi:two-component system, OmpR family, alkaline phosphatase synthesis response regulator PhoP